MRRLELCLLVSGVLAFAACGGGGSKAPTDGGAGKGGHSGTGGSTGNAGTGGSTGNAGTGGSTGNAGTGGSSAGMDGGAGSMAGTGGSTAGMDGGAGTGDAPVDKTDAKDGPMDTPTDVMLTTQQLRGQYLVNVIGCTGCHLANLSGKDNFVNAANGTLSSANLTNDATGIKNFSDQAIIDAIRTGKDPDQTGADGGTIYLSARMPYYQFSVLTDDDAKAIVAYLRTVTGVAHTVAAATGTFATPPTSPEWTPITVASLPSPTADAGADAGTASISNGKYMAGLLCVTCHTVTTSASSPKMLDVAKAFQGGVQTSVTVPSDGGVDAGDGGTVTESIQSANLTPDSTGLAGWTADQIATAITAAKDKMNRSICGMRANATIGTTNDPKDIAAYLQAIPAVVNAPSPTCY
jgi:hypothetical protein